MIAEVNVQNALGKRIRPSRQPSYKGEPEILLAENVKMPGDQITVLLSDFLTLFGNAEWSYAALKSADPQDTWGYHPYFDAWKAEGIIS